MDELITELRAICIASQGGLHLNSLRKDYIELGGSHDTYRALGYKTLDDVIRAHPKEFNIRGDMIFAQGKEQSAHIQALVDNQKINRKRPKQVRRPIPRYTRYNVNTPQRYHSDYLRECRASPPQRRFYRNDDNPRERPVMTVPPRQVTMQGSAPRVTVTQRQVPVPAPQVRQQQLPAETQREIERKPWPAELFRDSSLKISLSTTSDKNNSTHQRKVTAVTTTEKPKTKAREVYRPPAPTQESDEEADFFPTVPNKIDVLRNASNSDIKLELPQTSVNTDLNQRLQIGRDTPHIMPLLPPNQFTSLGRKVSIADRFANSQSMRKEHFASLENPLLTKPQIREQLEELFHKNNLGPPDIQFLTEKRGDMTMYTGLLKINDVTIKGHTCVPNKDVAEEIVSWMGVNALLKRADSSTMADFLSGVIQILVENGPIVWLSSLPDAYHEKFNDHLPANWLDIIRQSPLFSITTLMDREQLTLAKDMICQKPPPGFSSAHHDANVTQMPTNRETRKLPELIFPNDTIWEVYVLSANDPQKLVVQLNDEQANNERNEFFTALALEMTDETNNAAVNLVEGEMYVAKLPNAYYVRCQLMELRPDDTALVYNIDEGEIEDIPTSNIFYIRDKYFQLPAQAFNLSLVGLETFPNSEQLLISLDKHLTRKTHVLEVSEIFRTEGGDTPCVAGILYDTFTANDIVVNLLIMEEIVAELSPIQLTTKAPQIMTLSCLDDFVYLHEDGRKGVECVECLIDYAYRLIGADLLPVNNIVCDKMFLATNPLTSTLARCQLKGVSCKTSHILVHFVDFGNSCEMLVSDLIDASTLSNALISAPPQTIKTKLDGIDPISDQVKEKINQFLSDKPFTVRTIDVKQSVPVVEIYIKDPITHSRMYLQDVIAPKQCNGSLSIVESLPDPPLPQVKKLIFVEVILPASPQFFFVQLSDYADELQKLMCALQTAGLQSLPVPASNTLQPGGYYAMQYLSHWYRGQINEVLSDSLFGVQLCDYAQMTVLSTECIRELPSQFRKLPKQAVRATLGVSPAGADWSPTDCVMFKELVADKKLAAVVLNILEGEDRSVLELQLIDTNTPDDDINIGEHLKQKGIAKQS